MGRIARLAALLLIVAAGVSPAFAQQTQTRLALVIGNAHYQSGGPATAANDAGLVAQTLQAAGFDVVGARDLDLDSMRRAFRDFLDKASAAGPNAVAFVYFSGYALQLEGENYLIPSDARLARDTDVPVEALRLSDYTKALAALHMKAMFVVLDAAREQPFAKGGQPLASGLALMEPDPGVLVAFNATPGTVAPDEQGPYGVYAQALVEMMRAGGLSPAELFDRVRLRVNDLSKGAEVPWDESKIDAPFVFFERAPDAPAAAASNDQMAAIRSRPIGDLDAHEAYLIALDRDTLEGYEDFLAAFPRDPMAKRVRAILAARREAIVWRRTCVISTPQAYWSYLRHYPDGPHAWDARRRLRELAAALEPPPSFPLVVYDVPPPPPEEIVYVDRPVLVFDDPDFGFAPPPPPPVYLLPPRPPELIVLPPPPPPTIAFVLPVPAFVPMPAYINPPRYVAPPPNNVVFTNIHRTTIISNTTVNNPAGAGAAAGVAATPPPPALPPSVAQWASLQSPGATPGAPPGGAPPGGAPRNAPGSHLPSGNQLPPAGQPGRSGGTQPGATPQAGRPPLHGQPLNRSAAMPPPNAPGAPASGAQRAPANSAPAQQSQGPRQGNGSQGGGPDGNQPSGENHGRTPADASRQGPAGPESHRPTPPAIANVHAAPPAPPSQPARPRPPAASVASAPSAPRPAPPPHPHVDPPARAAAAAPPHPAKPACPPGKSMQMVNGHPACK